MTLAEQLIERYQLDFPHPGHTEGMKLAFNDFLERAACECEAVGQEFVAKQHMGPSLGSSACALRIRSLKREA